MKRFWWKSLFIFITVASLFACIEPYSPNIGKFESDLVVDALLTDEDVSNYVTISRTKKTVEEDAVMVSGAQVIISDDLGNSTLLTETTEGKYKTDSLTFRGEPGRSYTLNIKTAGGQEYKSESCFMNPVLDIDTIYFCKNEKLVDNETQEGIDIYLDSKVKNGGSYYRWTYKEYWKIEAPYPKRFNYVNDHTFTEYSPVKKICWGNNKSDEIIIRSAETGFSQPILFVPSEKTPRLLVQYCIEVRQLSVSKEEYEFWDCMKQIGESGGDIFDKQPFQISGNIHNVNNNDEQVLGYFQVSAAKVKRRYITYAEAHKAGAPRYVYPCKVLMISLDDAPSSMKNPTFDAIYDYYTNEGLIFVEPVLDMGQLKKLVFVTPLCTDCTLSGSLTKPYFWIDIE